MHKFGWSSGRCRDPEGLIGGQLGMEYGTGDTPTTWVWAWEEAGPLPEKNELFA